MHVGAFGTGIRSEGCIFPVQWLSKVPLALAMMLRLMRQPVEAVGCL